MKHDPPWRINNQELVRLDAELVRPWRMII